MISLVSYQLLLALKYRFLVPFLNAKLSEERFLALLHNRPLRSHSLLPRQTQRRVRFLLHLHPRNQSLPQTHFQQVDQADHLVVVLRAGPNFIAVL